MDISSYTAASTLPKKLLCNTDLLDDIKSRKIKPYHIQLNPTNKCPLNCSFCSCRNRNREEVLSLEYAKYIILSFKELGTKAITITGGGDPLAYPHLKELLEYCTSLDIETGLVTNGILFGIIDKSILRHLTWCRVSVSDEQPVPKHLSNVVDQDIDWAFSYVLNGNNVGNLINCIDFANSNKFTHLRLVDDILSNDSKMINVKQILFDRGIDDSKVIYQGRKKYTKGHKRCFISLLKPNIDPSGNILPCCGIQYAFDNPAYDFDKKAIMNNNLPIKELYNKQLYFDGSNCVKCYYSDYNEVMNMLWDSNKLEHKRFI